ncbi:MAG: hypothetical protein SFY66_10825 [Oculatellaceae cyanobacterium bins.114]|nr:hypothetical protein [Oculatellaceae cyanobacterium bins.114]
MSKWLKWSIAGLVAFFVIGSIWNAATNPPLSPIEIQAREAQFRLMEYYKSSCDAGNQIDCGKYEQIQKELNEN